MVFPDEYDSTWFDWVDSTNSASLNWEEEEKEEWQNKVFSNAMGIPTDFEAFKNHVLPPGSKIGEKQNDKVLHYYEYDDYITIQSMIQRETHDVNYFVGSPDSFEEHQILSAIIKNPNLVVSNTQVSEDYGIDLSDDIYNYQSSEPIIQSCSSFELNREAEEDFISETSIGIIDKYGVNENNEVLQTSTSYTFDYNTHLSRWNSEESSLTVKEYYEGLTNVLAIDYSNAVNDNPKAVHEITSNPEYGARTSGIIQFSAFKEEKGAARVKIRDEDDTFCILKAQPDTNTWTAYKDGNYEPIADPEVNANQWVGFKIEYHLESNKFKLWYKTSEDFIYSGEYDLDGIGNDEELSEIMFQMANGDEYDSVFYVDNIQIPGPSQTGMKEAVLYSTKRYEKTDLINDIQVKDYRNLFESSDETHFSSIGNYFEYDDSVFFWNEYEDMLMYAESDGNPYLSDNFNEISPTYSFNNPLSSENGWIAVPSEASIVSEYGGRSNVLCIEDTDSSSSITQLSFDGQDSGSIEFLWRVADVTGSGATTCMYLKNSQGGTLSYLYLSGSELRVQESGGYQVLDENIAENTWYKVRLDFDVNQGTHGEYDIYLNGNKVGESILLEDLGDSYTVDIFQIYTYNDITCKVYFDDLDLSWEHDFIRDETHNYGWNLETIDSQEDIQVISDAEIGYHVLRMDGDSIISRSFNNFGRTEHLLEFKIAVSDEESEYAIKLQDGDDLAVKIEIIEGLIYLKYMEDGEWVNNPIDVNNDHIGDITILENIFMNFKIAVNGDYHYLWINNIFCGYYEHGLDSQSYIDTIRIKGKCDDSSYIYIDDIKESPKPSEEISFLSIESTANGGNTLEFDIDGGRSVGTLSFEFIVPDLMNTYDIKLVEDTVTDHGIRLRITNGSLQYYTNDQWFDTALEIHENREYAVQLEFNCTSQQYNLLLKDFAYSGLSLSHGTPQTLSFIEVEQQNVGEALELVQLSLHKYAWQIQGYDRRVLYTDVKIDDQYYDYNLYWNGQFSDNNGHWVGGYDYYGNFVSYDGIEEIWDLNDVENPIYLDGADKVHKINEWRYGHSPGIPNANDSSYHEIIIDGKKYPAGLTFKSYNVAADTLILNGWTQEMDEIYDIGDNYAVYDEDFDLVIVNASMVKILDDEGTLMTDYESFVNSETVLHPGSKIMQISPANKYVLDFLRRILNAYTSQHWQLNENAFDSDFTANAYTILDLSDQFIGDVNSKSLSETALLYYTETVHGFGLQKEVANVREIPIAIDFNSDYYENHPNYKRTIITTAGTNFYHVDCDVNGAFDYDSITFDDSSKFVEFNDIVILSKKTDDADEETSVNMHLNSHDLMFEILKHRESVVIGDLPWMYGSEWEHIVIVKESTTISIYQNGVHLHDTQVPGEIDINNNNLWIGKGYAGSPNTRYWHGWLDDFQIYSGSFSSEDIRSLSEIYNSADESYYNGVDAYDDTDNDLGALTDDVTISMWIKPGESQASNAVVFGNLEATEKHGIALQQNNDNQNQYHFRYADGNSIHNGGTITLADSYWQHLVIVKTDSELKYYVNGLEVTDATVTDSGSIDLSGADLQIGNGYLDNPTDRYWNGWLEDFNIYAKSFTDDEVMETYQDSVEYNYAGPFTSGKAEIALEETGTYYLTLVTVTDDYFMEITANEQVNITNGEKTSIGLQSKVLSEDWTTSSDQYSVPAVSGQYEMESAPLIEDRFEDYQYNGWTSAYGYSDRTLTAGCENEGYFVDTDCAGGSGTAIIAGLEDITEMDGDMRIVEALRYDDSWALYVKHSGNNNFHYMTLDGFENPFINFNSDIHTLISTKLKMVVGWTQENGGDDWIRMDCKVKVINPDTGIETTESEWQNIAFPGVDNEDSDCIYKEITITDNNILNAIENGAYIYQIEFRLDLHSCLPDYFYIDKFEIDYEISEFTGESTENNGKLYLNTDDSNSNNWWPNDIESVVSSKQLPVSDDWESLVQLDDIAGNHDCRSAGLFISRNNPQSDRRYVYLLGNHEYSSLRLEHIDDQSSQGWDLDGFEFGDWLAIKCEDNTLYFGSSSDGINIEYSDITVNNNVFDAQYIGLFAKTWSVTSDESDITAVFDNFILNEIENKIVSIKDHNLDTIDAIQDTSSGYEFIKNEDFQLLDSDSDGIKDQVKWLSTGKKPIDSNSFKLLGTINNDCVTSGELKDIINWYGSDPYSAKYDVLELYDCGTAYRSYAEHDMDIDLNQKTTFETTISTNNTNYQSSILLMSNTGTDTTIGLNITIDNGYFYIGSGDIQTNGANHLTYNTSIEAMNSTQYEIQCIVDAYENGYDGGVVSLFINDEYIDTYSIGLIDNFYSIRAQTGISDRNYYSRIEEVIRYWNSDVNDDLEMDTTQKYEYTPFRETEGVIEDWDQYNGYFSLLEQNNEDNSIFNDYYDILKIYDGSSATSSILKSTTYQSSLEGIYSVQIGTDHSEKLSEIALLGQEHYQNDFDTLNNYDWLMQNIQLSQFEYEQDQFVGNVSYMQPDARLIPNNTLNTANGIESIEFTFAVENSSALSNIYFLSLEGNDIGGLQIENGNLKVMWDENLNPIDTNIDLLSDEYYQILIYQHISEISIWLKDINGTVQSLGEDSLNERLSSLAFSPSSDSDIYIDDLGIYSTMETEVMRFCIFKDEAWIRQLDLAYSLTKNDDDDYNYTFGEYSYETPPRVIDSNGASNGTSYVENVDYILLDNDTNGLFDGLRWLQTGNNPSVDASFQIVGDTFTSIDTNIDSDQFYRVRIPYSISDQQYSIIINNQESDSFSFNNSTTRISGIQFKTSRSSDSYSIYLNDVGFKSYDHDSDSDLLSDAEEYALNPTHYQQSSYDIDSDADGLPDAWEMGVSKEGYSYMKFYDQSLVDFDIFDQDESEEDFDGDNLTNDLEYSIGTDPTCSDSDFDNMPDDWEYIMQLDPINRANDLDDQLGPDDDFDSDGMSNYQEFVQNPLLNPKSSDTDSDGMDDNWEVLNSLDPVTDDADDDADGDDLSNIDELMNDCNPQNADSDFDNLNDGAEVHTWNTDPLVDDSDGDTLLDGDEVNGIYISALSITVYPNPLALDTDSDDITDNNEIYGTFGHYTDPCDNDADDDGLQDGEEIDVYLTDPNNPDCDGDTITDGQEVLGYQGYTSDPWVTDTDGDGFSDDQEYNLGLDGFITDPSDPDTDGDQLSDKQEYDGTNGYISNPLAADSDLDGLDDYVETDTANGYITDPYNDDTDGDGLFDSTEINGVYSSDLGRTVFSNPLNSDTDSDQLGDITEMEALNGYITDPSVSDSDNDGIDDYTEINGWSNDAGNFNTDPTDPDSDGEGLWDGEELTYDTDPFVADTDSDGLSDWYEVDYNMNPVNDDVDEDGLSDGEEVNTYNSNWNSPDSDADTINDGEEVVAGSDGYITNIINPDTDGDTVNDNIEINGVNGYTSNPTQANSDSDGFSDNEELYSGCDGYITNPNNCDTDGDQLDDDEEYYGVNGYTSNPLQSNSDSDGFNDYEEVYSGADGYITDPLDSDTDGDDLSDSLEADWGSSKSHYTSNPLFQDSDGDLLTDKQEYDGQPDFPNHYSDPQIVDTDNDGYDDLFESDFRTNPRSSSSHPQCYSDASISTYGVSGVAADWVNRNCGSDQQAIQNDDGYYVWGGDYWVGGYLPDCKIKLRFNDYDMPSGLEYGGFEYVDEVCIRWKVRGVNTGSQNGYAGNLKLKIYMSEGATTQTREVYGSFGWETWRSATTSVKDWDAGGKTVLQRIQEGEHIDAIKTVMTVQCYQGPWYNRWSDTKCVVNQLVPRYYI